MVINRTDSSGVSSYDFFGYALFANPEWDFRTFNFDKDLKDADEKLAASHERHRPNLDRSASWAQAALLPRRGGPADSGAERINYYETVVARRAAAQKARERRGRSFGYFWCRAVSLRGRAGADGFRGQYGRAGARGMPIMMC